MNAPTKILLAAVALAAALGPGRALAYAVAVLPSRGPADDALRGELDAAVLAALEGNEIGPASEVAAALGQLSIDAVETQKQADMLGAKLGVSFVVAPWITPLAGQNRIEILVYFLPDGRAETLEQIALEGEMEPVVVSMIAKLVTKEGLLGAQPEPPAPEPEKPVEQPSEPTPDDLLEQIAGTAPVEEKPPKPGFGDPYRISIAVVGGYTLLLNEPAGDLPASFRSGGRVGAGIGYVFHKRIGLDVGGDIIAFLGPSGYGFGIAPALGIHGAVHERVYIGARLGIGFYKGATGSQRTSMIVRVAMTTEIVLHPRVFIRFEIPAFTMIAFGDSKRQVLGLLEIDAGLGVRF